MASNASRGAAAKGKTKKWLEKQGFAVADLEVVRWLHTPRGRLPVKRDQFASDLLAIDATRVVFVQVKSGKQVGPATEFPDAMRAFAEHTFPACSEQWVVGWPFRAREPRVVKAHVERALADLPKQGPITKVF